MSAWIEQIFEAQCAKAGGIVRRKIADVEKYASRQELVDAVLSRNYHLMETKTDFVINCDTAGQVQMQA